MNTQNLLSVYTICDLAEREFYVTTHTYTYMFSLSVFYFDVSYYYDICFSPFL